MTAQFSFDSYLVYTNVDKYQIMASFKTYKCRNQLNMMLIKRKSINKIHFQRYTVVKGVLAPGFYKRHLFYSPA